MFVCPETKQQDRYAGVNQPSAFASVLERRPVLKGRREGRMPPVQSRMFANVCVDGVVNQRGRSASLPHERVWSRTVAKAGRAMLHAQRQRGRSQSFRRDMENMGKAYVVGKWPARRVIRSYGTTMCCRLAA